MASKGPHISIASDQLLSRVLFLDAPAVADWPEDVRELALRLAEELFLLRYNPFIDPGLVYVSVKSRMRDALPSLAPEFAEVLEQSVRTFWKEYQDDQAFKEKLLSRLGKILSQDMISTRPNTLVECATDATDLRMEIPMAIVSPVTTEQVQKIILLANELGFSIVPRGGGSGLTGGAIPAMRRTIILSLGKFKKILDVDPEAKVLCAQAGVITLDAINAASEQGLLFTVDPASKSASSLGGNISENSGGPFCFEYGTTIDNILSFHIVTPLGDILEVRRKDHPWTKILPGDEAVFEVCKVLPGDGRELQETIRLAGEVVRSPGLGKDVTNKFMGGLPGVQKEGVDGIITEACFTLHDKLAHSRTLCLEFFGRTMHNAMLVIKDLVALRDVIRSQGDLVKMSALEEFNIKYVQAIDYRKKSSSYEGMPISVLLVQLDSNDETALENTVASILDIVAPYDNADVFEARDEKEAEVFWEDRHKLSAISKRTSGFKINEDIVIPTDVIPEFALFLEELNLHYLAKAYRVALNMVSELPWVAVDDPFLEMERDFSSAILTGEATTKKLSEQELEMQVFYFFQDLRSRYPGIKDELEHIYQEMQATRIILASHMHAGDGNCHVNIPVNSNDPHMLHEAESAAEKVFTKVLHLNGQVSGEHGIGITKIKFLSEDKIEALRAFKEKVDPKDVLNPGKLTTRTLPVAPYTFSFNRLIQDIRKSGLPEKERLINLLQNIQICTRCGKCKQFCPMHHPEKNLVFHPRNKNISLGALIEAIYYSQINRGVPDKRLLDELRSLMEHCTGCGKCTAICPVKIDSPKVMLHLRSFLEDKQSGGHPVKTKVLEYLVGAPTRRVPLAAKAASVAQNLQNKAIGLVPAAWRRRFDSPLFSGPGPVTDFNNLTETLQLSKGSIFLPGARPPGRTEAVFYFPGCGGGLFYRSIGLAALKLLLEQGVGVMLPKEHLCCGYPLLISGCEEAYTTNQARNIFAFRKLLDEAKAEGVYVRTLLTACGSCRDGLERYELDMSLREKLSLMDVVQYIIQLTPSSALADGTAPEQGALLYHAACHAEWSGIPSTKAGEAYRSALAAFTGREVAISPRCCGESGLGALTSPKIYSRLQERKRKQLGADLAAYPDDAPIVVGCPSCKVGISRNLMAMKKKQPVLHTLEYLARELHGPDWQEQLLEAARKSVTPGSPIRPMQLK